MYYIDKYNFYYFKNYIIHLYIPNNDFSIQVILNSFYVNVKFHKIIYTPQQNMKIYELPTKVF